MDILKNDLIRLRAVEPSDAEKMWEMECDSEQWIHNGMSAPYSLNNLRDYANNYDADPIRSGQLRLIIEKNDDHNVIGMIDLYDISPIHRTAFIGIYISKAFRREGYALLAIGLLEKYCSNLLNLFQIGAKIMDGNVPSELLFEKAGFIRQCILPKWYK
ncbi:MAG: GNAT family N-acetyltransferase, partial [Muribaculaceae bacterium]|nr:GNAT family N-acetyltransferase [Muribaculaceae bacterium]